MIKMTIREATDDDYRSLRVPNYIQKNIAKKYLISVDGYYYVYTDRGSIFERYQVSLENTEVCIVDNYFILGIRISQILKNTLRLNFYQLSIILIFINIQPVIQGIKQYKYSIQRIYSRQSCISNNEKIS